MHDNDLVNLLVFVGVFAGTVGAMVLVFLKLSSDKRQTVARLRDLAAPASSEAERGGVGELALSALPRVGNLLLPGKEKQRFDLQARLRLAGLYGPLAVRLFLGVKVLLLLVLPMLLGLAPYLAGITSGRWALCLASTGAGLGMVVPGLWVDHRRKQRQSELRRGLADALDMMVLCMEGGLSLLVTVQRVAAELQRAHPLLGAELNIVQREINLGLSVGEAMRKLGQRCDLEEVRNLASVLLQSERFGASVSKALRIHADGCRQERQQRAEELAQKAAVKILFPTLLCIFPAIFIVILGPAAQRMARMFSNIK